MTKYRKKPVTIEAMQLTEDTQKEVAEWCGGHPYKNPKDGIVVPTLEGELHASLGDWVIKGIIGEFYPCKPDIFERMYDLAE